MTPDPSVAGSSAVPSLAKGAAAVSLWTAISRVTGFFRVVAVAAALGATHLANTYNSANAAPNLIFELMAAGVLTSVFVPTFVERIVKGDRGDRWDAGNALTSSALVVLTAVSVVVVLTAPWLMQFLLIGVEPAVRPEAVMVGTDLLRLFAPQIMLYGAGMIMTAALHAHRRFTMAAIAPIFNNVVVIVTYLTYAGMRGSRSPDVGSITTAETWVLGGGTTLGVVAMTICLVPSLRSLGWRFRFRPDFRHPAVRRGARLGVWALSYAGGYQAGLIVVLLLANRIEGGFAAYQWAFTFFYLPHALFGVPIFNVLFTAMSEHVAADQVPEVAARLRDGMRMLAFLLFPVAAGIFVLSGPLTESTLRYGVMTDEGARLVGRVLSTFAIGLPVFSAFLVLTRAFYAFGDTRTPALINLVTVVTSSLVGMAAFAWAPSGWEVAGLALGHSIGALVGYGLSMRSLRVRTGPIFDKDSISAVAVYFVGAALAGAGMWLVSSVSGNLVGDLAAAASFGGFIYLILSALAGSRELTRLRVLVRQIAGRGAAA